MSLVAWLTALKAIPIQAKSPAMRPAIAIATLRLGAVLLEMVRCRAAHDWRELAEGVAEGARLQRELVRDEHRAKKAEAAKKLAAAEAATDRITYDRAIVRLKASEQSRKLLEAVTNENERRQEEERQREAQRKAVEAAHEKLLDALGVLRSKNGELFVDGVSLQAMLEHGYLPPPSADAEPGVPSASGSPRRAEIIEQHGLVPAGQADTQQHTGLSEIVFAPPSSAGMAKSAVPDLLQNAWDATFSEELAPDTQSKLSGAHKLSIETNIPYEEPSPEPARPKPRKKKPKK